MRWSIGCWTQLEGCVLEIVSYPILSALPLLLTSSPVRRKKPVSPHSPATMMLCNPGLIPLKLWSRTNVFSSYYSTRWFGHSYVKITNTDTKLENSSPQTSSLAGSQILHFCLGILFMISNWDRPWDVPVPLTISCTQRVAKSLVYRTIITGLRKESDRTDSAVSSGSVPHEGGLKCHNGRSIYLLKDSFSWCSLFKDPSYSHSAMLIKNLVPWVVTGNMVSL